MNIDRDTKGLNFVGHDPGAVRYGNFINYYTFHSTKQRTDHFNSQMFPVHTSNEDILCLDIGCNIGELTREVHVYLKNIYPNCNVRILAVDIDPILIQRAQEVNQDEHLTFAVADIIEESGYDTVQKYLDLFKTKKFDITFCFSVTMWIHLNSGDEGLIKLLEFLKNISKTIIIEDQPWKCYGHAQRRMTKSGSSFPLYKTLKIRSNVCSVIEQTLIENSHQKVYESPNSPWDRKIKSFQVN